MIQTTMTDAEFEALISTVFGSLPDPSATARTREADSRRRDRLRWLFADADTQADIRGTAWAGYQSITEYVDHYAPVRGTARHGGDESAARAARVLTSEDPDRLKRNAWSALIG